MRILLGVCAVQILQYNAAADKKTILCATSQGLNLVLMGEEEVLFFLHGDCYSYTAV